MTAREKAVVRAIIKALHVKRDRLGRLEQTRFSGVDLQAIKMSFPLPHGGLDQIDAAVMVLQALCGDPVESILDKEGAG